MQAYQIAIAAAQGASVAGGRLPVAGGWAAKNTLSHMRQCQGVSLCEYGFIDPSEGSMGARMN